VSVTRRPLAVIVLTVIVTVVLGGLSSQAVFEDGAPVDNDLARALEAIEGRFGDRTAVLQVVIEASDGADVRSVDGLTASLAVQDAIADDPVGDTLVDGGAQPPIVSYLAGAEVALAQRGGDPADLSDEEVRELQEAGRAVLPDEAAAQLDELLGDGDPPTVGLILVFQDTEGLDEDEELDRQRELAAVVDAVEPPSGIEVTAFSFALLTEDGEIGGEVGRLFGTALAIILAVLGVVYWLRPAEGHRGRMLRRTVADVASTLLVILFAVVWMQGLGTLLGPGFLGLIGPFNPQTQVVPILIVGLGVDFSIHLLARYRSETGERRDPTAGYLRAFATVGLALFLDTVATAIGFLTNLVSPVEFLRTLGVLAAVGITAAFVLTITFLPAIRLLLDRRAVRRDRLPTTELSQADTSVLPRIMGRTTVLAERAPWAVVVVAVALTGVGGYGFTQLDSRFALTDFVPQDEPLLAVFETVQEAFGGAFDETTDVLLTGDVATPQAHDALVASLDALADVEGVGTVGGRADATSVVSVLGRLAGEDGQLREELATLGLQEDLTVADDADVPTLYEAVLDADDEAGEVLARDGDGWASRVRLRTSVEQDEAEQLRTEVSAALGPVEDADVEVVVTSQQLVQASVSEEIEEAQLQAIGIALAAVMVLLALFFGVRRRQPLIGVLTVLPVGFVLASTFGMMALTDIPLNPVTATLAALSIGIGVPFNIHVASRYLEERDEQVAGALDRAVSRTGGAVIASALTTGIGFGVLTTSTLLPFEQLGYVIVYAIVLSAIASTIVLPSLLALWERRQPARGGARPVEA
jgi:uncharacterized protein